MKLLSIAGFLGLASIIVLLNWPTYTPKTIQKQAFLRVISLAPSITETVAALGQEHLLVGVTSHCSKTINNVQVVGSFAEPNFEAIMALKPDLVLAVPHIMATETLLRLKEHNIEVFAHQPDSLADIKFVISEIARKLNAELEGVELVTKIDLALKNAQEDILSMGDKYKNKSLLIAVSHTPLVVAGKKTFASEILESLGFVNQAENPSTAWPVWPLENLLKNPPNIFILSDGKEQLLRYHNLFTALKLDLSSKNITLIVPDRPLFMTPSPVLIDDAEYLVKLLKLEGV